MSASARARASQKYKLRLALQRGGYGPRTGTPMSGAERARRFRERRKADLASTTGIPIIMDITNEQTIDILSSIILSNIAAQYMLCKKWKRGYMAYPKSMRLALQGGPPWCRPIATLTANFVDFVLVFWQLGICVIYFVFMAENIKDVCDYFGYVYNIRLHIVFLLVPNILTNLVKNLKLMTPFSSISNGVTIFGLMLIFFYLIEDDVHLEPEKFTVKSLADIPMFIGTALFAMEAVGVILALEYNMENPKQFVGLFGLLNLGMSIIVFLYALVGFSGYVKYGEDIRSAITRNLPSRDKKAQMAKLLFVLAIFLTLPLQNFVAYEIVWRRMKKSLHHHHKRRFPDPGTSEHTASFCIYDYIIRVVLVLIPWGLAIALPTLGPFLGLFGAFCLSLLAIVFPAIMDMCCWYDHPDGFGPGRYRMYRDVLIIIIGLSCLISGCYASVFEIIHAMSVMDDSPDDVN